MDEGSSRTLTGDSYVTSFSGDLQGIDANGYRLFAENRFVAAVLKGMQSGVAAVILDVALSMGANVIKERSAVHTLILAAAFCASFFLRVNVVWIVLCAALIGIVQVLRSRKGVTGA